MVSALAQAWGSRLLVLVGVGADAKGALAFEELGGWVRNSARVVRSRDVNAGELWIYADTKLAGSCFGNNNREAGHQWPSIHPQKSNATAALSITERLTRFSRRVSARKSHVIVLCARRFRECDGKQESNVSPF